MRIGLYTSSLHIFDYKQIRDNYAYRWYVLAQSFKRNGVELIPFNDSLQGNQFDVVIDNGIQNSENKNKYLLIIESTLMRPQDWDLERHKTYQKIFCWDDTLIDNKIYFKLNYAFDIPKTIPKIFHGKKLCCTIAGNKTSSHPDELYSKRVESIRWFEKNHPDDFDLYGTGWDEYRFGRSLLGKALNKLSFLRHSSFSSYKGPVTSKFETMTHYKFSLCYENIKDQYGYITEKIFDSFFAGCVPIYWGAKNISEHIPAECFIDKRDFSSYDELYQYIKTMDQSTYLCYLDKIESFLNSPKADPFRAESFADTIIREILKDHGEACVFPR